MVPGTVVKLTSQHVFVAVGAILQLLSLEADEELVNRIDIRHASRTIADQGTVAFSVSTEPEHQSVVLFAGALQVFRLHMQALDIPCHVTVQMERHATWQCPSNTVQRQVGTQGMISDIDAIALAHRVIVCQAHLITRQQLMPVGIQQRAVQGSFPYTAL